MIWCAASKHLPDDLRAELAGSFARILTDDLPEPWNFTSVLAGALRDEDLDTVLAQAPSEELLVALVDRLDDAQLERALEVALRAEWSGVVAALLERLPRARALQVVQGLTLERARLAGIAILLAGADDVEVVGLEQMAATMTGIDRQLDAFLAAVLEALASRGRADFAAQIA
jgi:hypothetical protein